MYRKNGKLMAAEAFTLCFQLAVREKKMEKSGMKDVACGCQVRISGPLKRNDFDMHVETHYHSNFVLLIIRFSLMISPPWKTIHCLKAWDCKDFWAAGCFNWEYSILRFFCFFVICSLRIFDFKIFDDLFN